MSKLHRFLNWPKKVHKYRLSQVSSDLAICDYCDDIFIIRNQDRLPYGIGAKLPNENCSRSKL